jgi:hypothetical protein
MAEQIVHILHGATSGCTIGNGTFGGYMCGAPSLASRHPSDPLASHSWVMFSHLDLHGHKVNCGECLAAAAAVGLRDSVGADDYFGRGW